MSFERPPRLKNGKLFLDRLSIIVISQSHIGINANKVGMAKFHVHGRACPGSKMSLGARKRSVAL